MNTRRPPSPRLRATLTALVGAGTAVLLAGCTTAPPAPEPEAPVVAAVVSASQERKILDSVSAVLERANGEDAAPLGSRLTGPALTTREAELRIATRAEDQALLTDLTLEARLMVLPSDEGWPRRSYVVMEPPGPKIAPVLAVFEQAGPREQYKLWAYVRLAPGVTLPHFAEPVLGSPAVAPDDDGLLVPPGQVAEQYASLLTAGERSRYADTFTDDDYLSDWLRSSGRRQVAEIEKADGTGSFEVAFEPADEPVVAVRTLDGGAMVVVALRGQETLRAEEHWQLAPRSPSVAALWDDGDGTNVLRTSYHHTVALYVPPAGSGARVSLLGVQPVPFAVSAG
ncbi:hypothetical protein ACFQBY_14360 [Promicromonospora citrea]|uniref:hypothetical protein n=1 Tax=Promicromonospora citrea TaxID=43677 RepID=UPI001E442840|nr:hypothetical protein [Promicromonospora citrea]